MGFWDEEEEAAREEAEGRDEGAIPARQGQCRQGTGMLGVCTVPAQPQSHEDGLQHPHPGWKTPGIQQDGLGPARVKHQTPGGATKPGNAGGP